MTERTLEVMALDLLDYPWEQLTGRLEGLTDDEYGWQPDPDGWTVVAEGQERWRAQIERPSPEPAPVTSIAWRMWHIGEDCFEYYSGRAFGSTGLDLVEGDWVGSCDEAIDALAKCFDNFRAGIAGLGDRLLDKLGPEWGPFEHHSFFDLAVHAQRELVHHGAEIAVLRDMYRVRNLPE